MRSKASQYKVLYISVAVMVLAIAGGIIFALNYTPRNENRNLKLTFDYAGFTKTSYVGTVVFKKDFDDVSLKINYHPDTRFYSGGSAGNIAYNVDLTDANGEPVTSVIAGVEYRFYAKVMPEKKPDLKIIAAGQEVQDESSSVLIFYSGDTILFRIRNR